MYESKSHPLLSRARFLKRVTSHFLMALLVVVLALGIGVVGYHWLGHLGWIDSLLNATMILGGMGRSILFIQAQPKYLLHFMPFSPV